MISVILMISFMGRAVFAQEYDFGECKASEDMSVQISKGAHMGQIKDKVSEKLKQNEKVTLADVVIEIVNALDDYYTKRAAYQNDNCPEVLVESASSVLFEAINQAQSEEMKTLLTDGFNSSENQKQKQTFMRMRIQSLNF